jgi:hypothetical protein
MNKRYDICTPRKGRDDKTFWTRIGTAFEGEKGIQLIFDALPIPDSEGRCVANLFEPRDSNGGRDTGQRQSRRPAMADDLDDSTPF